MTRQIVRGGLAVSLVLLLLSACGGGGESTEPTAQAQQARVDALPKQESVQALKANRSGPPTAKRNYIVQLSEPPVTAYEGGVSGHAPTRPASGEKLDSSQPAVARYREHLKSRQAAVLAAAGGGKMLHNYAYVFNGFAAELSEAQAIKLAQSPNVLSVSKDERRRPSTSSTPAFLELSGRDGLWRESGARGEDVIIGVIDTGIWPEHPSFSDRTPWGERKYGRPRGWHGSCQTGVQFTASDCNRKLIGARYFTAGSGGDAAILAAFPYEFLSPRDFDGHGTHTASTAGGNADTPVSGPAAVFGKISGMAPRARIAAYKACWGVGEGSGCVDSDTIAAIDQAVADGVDVINYSVGGLADPLWPVAIAFMRAANAGVFVAAAGGNAGPDAGTVEHSSPWVTTVAAGTHDRARGESSVRLGNGTSYTGASLATKVPSSPFVDSVAAAMAGADPQKAALCFSAADNGGVPVLDPAKVAGKVVLCDRGTNARLAKSEAVQQAGGVGMILVNVAVIQTLNADLHFVPTVHLPVADRPAIKSYAALAGASAAIAQVRISYTAPAPFTAVFSSRGPNAAVSGDILKPDIIAPGQDVLAGVAPPGRGDLFGVLSGTSMSSPHVAGVAALIKELHPRWSPMAIKSALMTTAGDVLDGPNTDPEVLFAQGAGHVRPSMATDPGLVFDSDVKDWIGYLCGAGAPTAICTATGIPVLDPSDMNLASIAVGDLAGTQTVTRRVTNVDSAYATYTPRYVGLAGFDVSIKPSALTLAPGQTKTFRVTFTRTTAPFNSFVGGQLTWSGGTSRRKSDRHDVRVPVALRPAALSVPAEVGGSYQLKFGYTGPFTATARGLIPAKTFDASIATGGVVSIPVTVAAGSTYARFSLFDANVSQQSDLDMEVYDPSGALVAFSGGATATESVSVPNPTPGVYTVKIYGFSVPTPSAQFSLFTWVLGTANAGNMTVVAPSSAVTAATGSITLSFNGLAPGKKYLGSVAYGANPALPGPTIVRVDP